MDQILTQFGAPDQLGFVVPDMNAAIDTFSAIYQFDETRRFDFKAEEHWVHGELFPIHIDIFHGVQGDMEYELIQPLSDGPHKWFLDKVGGGLQHIGYNVDAYEPYAEALGKAGFGVLMNVDMDVFEPGASAPDHHVKAAYFEKPSMGNMLIEIAARMPY